MKQEEILIDFPVAVDPRGSLAIAEETALPFEVKRVFWIYDIAEEKTRGGHAHTSCEEIVIAVAGSFDMVVDNGHERMAVRMDSPSRGIYIQKNVWCELRNFSSGTVCIVLASEPYNMNGYMKDYEEFKERMKNLGNKEYAGSSALS